MHNLSEDKYLMDPGWHCTSIPGSDLAAGQGVVSVTACANCASLVWHPVSFVSTQDLSAAWEHPSYCWRAPKTKTTTKYPSVNHHLKQSPKVQVCLDSLISAAWRSLSCFCPSPCTVATPHIPSIATGQWSSRGTSQASRVVPFIHSKLSS